MLEREGTASQAIAPQSSVIGLIFWNLVYDDVLKPLTLRSVLIISPDSPKFRERRKWTWKKTQ